MKQFKNLFVGILLLGSIHVSALPYSPIVKNGFVCIDSKPICKENSTSDSLPVLIYRDQQILGNGNIQDKNPKPNKKQNRSNQRQQLVIGISKTAGDILFVLVEVAFEIASQVCLDSL